MKPFTSPAGRQPRGLVKLSSGPDRNGTAVTGAVIHGWIEFEVTNNSYYSADTFRCKFANAMLPAATNAVWFSQQQDMFVELFIGFPKDPANYTAAELQSWIYGQVDHISIDPVTNTIEVDGRDLTRVFIDAKTTQKWPNQTSSQIATMLAQKHGLTAVVTATKTMVGKYYEIDHVNMADERSEWDILNYLADLEGFKVWVRGQNLYFQPPSTVQAIDTTSIEQQLAQIKAAWQVDLDQQATLLNKGMDEKKSASAAAAAGDTVTQKENLQAALSYFNQAGAIGSAATAKYQPQYDALQAKIAAAKNNSGTYQIVWQPVSTTSGPRANFDAIRLTRALTVSRGIQVKIRSWNKKYAKGFVVAYPSSVKTIRVGSSSIGAGGQIHSKTIPNLTQDQALQRAQQWYKQLVAHEMKIEGLTMPGDNALDITSIIEFSGTGTGFDQQYFPDSISRHMTFDGGYEMTVSAKNHSPDSTVIA